MTGFVGDPPRLCETCGNKMQWQEYRCDREQCEAYHSRVFCACCDDVEKRRALNERSGL